MVFHLNTQQHNFIDNSSTASGISNDALQRKGCPRVPLQLAETLNFSPNSSSDWLEGPLVALCTFHNLNAALHRVTCLHSIRDYVTMATFLTKMSYTIHGMVLMLATHLSTSRKRLLSGHTSCSACAAGTCNVMVSHQHKVQRHPVFSSENS